MGLLDMFGGGDQAATPQAPGGGMFDAYSGQNQTNLQMAMLADMVGNFAGKDVGAMKSIMPLVENARKLRLEGVEAQQLQQRRDSAQKLISGYGGGYGGGQPAPGGAMPPRANLNPYQQAELQYLMVNSPHEVPGKLQDFMNQSAKLAASQVRQLSIEEAAGRRLPPGTQWQIDGNGRVSPMESNQAPANYMATMYADQIGGGLDDARDAHNAASQALPGIENMINLLEQHDVNTGFGAEYLLDYKRGLNAMGLDTDTTNIANMEQFLAESTKALLPQVKQLGVNPTDKDLDTIVKSSPGLTKTKAGNLLLLRTLKANYRRTLDKGTYMDTWAMTEGRKYNTDPAQYYLESRNASREFDKKPYFEALRKEAAVLALPIGTEQTRELIGGGKEYRRKVSETGWEPFTKTTNGAQ